MRKHRALSMVQACLQAENVSLDVNGVREKVLLINRLGGTVGRDDHVSAEICARWLIGGVISRIGGSDADEDMQRNSRSICDRYGRPLRMR
jgi:hypothetical protein